MYFTKELVCKQLWKTTTTNMSRHEAAVFAEAILDNVPGCAGEST